MSARRFDPSAGVVDMAALAADRSFARLTFFPPSPRAKMPGLYLPLWPENFTPGVWRCLRWINPQSALEAFTPDLLSFSEVHTASQREATQAPLDLRTPTRNRREIVEVFCLAIRFQVPLIFSYQEGDQVEERNATPWNFTGSYVRTTDHERSEAPRSFTLASILMVRAREDAEIPTWNPTECLYQGSER